MRARTEKVWAMKKLAKRDGARRYKIYRGPGTVDAIRAALYQATINLLAEMGEDRDCDYQIVESGPHGKPRLAIARNRKATKRQPVLARAKKR
jgi:hypothetical protein